MKAMEQIMKHIHQVGVQQQTPTKHQTRGKESSK